MTRLSRIAAASATLAALLLAPAPAEAQFGGLVKKAKEKIEQKSVEQAGDKLGPVAAGEQLTEELLGKVLAGATAADRVIGQRDAAALQREAKNKELSESSDKNAPMRRAYDEANSKILDCRSSTISKLETEREEKLSKQYEGMANDPAFSGKVQLVAMKYAQRMSEAQQKQDAAALGKAQQDMMAEILGYDFRTAAKGDSTAADTRCGKAPALPPALAREETLRKEIAVIDDQLRALEARAVNAGAAASGLEQVRYLQLKERALTIMQRMAGEGARVKFGDEETALVARRKAELEKVKRAL